MNARRFLVIVLTVSAAAQSQSSQAGPATTTTPPCPLFGSTPETYGKRATLPAVHQIHVKYPRDARKSHIEGIVELCVVIGKDGNVRNVSVISGAKELVPSAVEAIKHSQFRPFLADGEPVEAGAEMEVHFRLAGAQVWLE